MACDLPTRIQNSNSRLLLIKSSHAHVTLFLAKASVCLILLINSVYCLYGQNSSLPYHIHYTVEDGLPSNTVYCTVQDDRGFIWFGTDAGISRFDGLEFKNFTRNDGLPDNEILKLLKDSKGRIWMHTLNGKVGYIYQDRIFTSSNTLHSQKLIFKALFEMFWKFRGSSSFQVPNNPKYWHSLTFRC
jgi:ligand-binding sensor domain-containing protein